MQNYYNDIEQIEVRCPKPPEDLPEDIFFFISRHTPIVNVDLLIKDENERTLLAWRDDKFSNKGWHIPGGVIRCRETFSDRIQKVAQSELKIKSIECNLIPLCINEIFLKGDTRGHSISILYRCFLSKKVKLNNDNLTKLNEGYLKWHSKCPTNLTKVQHIYEYYINNR